MSLHKMIDLDLVQKKVLIREDFNVPIKSGVIQSDERLKRALDTIKLALQKNAAVLLCSHLGRPKEGIYDESLSLQPVADWLSKALDLPVRLEKNYLNSDVSINPGEVVLLENVRFNIGEKACEEGLSKKMANLCDIFVMDAFATAHRAQASTYGVTQFAKLACAGPLLVKEIENIEKSLSNAKAPVLAIVGGSKVSSKLTLLKKLVDQVDSLIVGGGIANTFLAAKGHEIGKSLVEPDLIETANNILLRAKQNSTELPLPVDAGVGKQFDEETPCDIKDLSEITSEDMIFDIGPQTAEIYAQLIKQANTIIWNGPVGVFEFPNFIGGTKMLSECIAESDAFSIAGGGDTIAAINQFDVTDDISYITTGGGAFLEYMEGKKLPAIEILETRYSS